MDTHPDAVKGQHVVIDDDVLIGQGTRIWNLVYIGRGTRIGSDVVVASLVHIAAGVAVGDGTMIEASACIGHQTRIGTNCFIGPGVITNADALPPTRRSTGVEAWEGVRIEDEAVICAGAIINAGVVVGRRAVVGMGSQVVSDVPPDTVVLGAPARPIYSRDEYDRRQRVSASKWTKAGLAARRAHVGAHLGVKASAPHQISRNGT